MPERPADEVDRITAAWNRERPDLDLAPLQIFSRASRLARHLEIARRRAFAGQSLETWEFDVLSSLRRAGAPYELTPGRLIEETLVSSGTMTNRIDRLVAEGLVERIPDPADRRVVRVRLTESGKDAVDAAMTSLLRFEHTHLTPLNEQQRTQLAAGLRSLLIPFDQPTSQPTTQPTTDSSAPPTAQSFPPPATGSSTEAP